MIDTHAHLDGEEFAEDRAEVMARAKETGVSKVLIPAIDYSSSVAVMQLCAQYPDFAYPMIGLHPEEVKENWREELEKIREYVFQDIIGIGEVGLDFYWSREYEKEQLAAFDEQVQWSIETRLPLMIHCRKGQNEMVHLLKQYERELPGGVFHCFTGNEREAADFLQFDRDSPYMAPVPMRGKRNESAFVRFVLQKLAECYGVTEEHVAEVTNQNVYRVFPSMSLSTR